MIIFALTHVGLGDLFWFVWRVQHPMTDVQSDVGLYMRLTEVY